MKTESTFASCHGMVRNWPKSEESQEFPKICCHTQMLQNFLTIWRNLKTNSHTRITGTNGARHQTETWDSLQCQTYYYTLGDSIADIFSSKMIFLHFRYHLNI